MSLFIHPNILSLLTFCSIASVSTPMGLMLAHPSGPYVKRMLPSGLNFLRHRGRRPQ